MKLPISWLKEYIKFSLSPEMLAEKLTLSGTKVEDVVNKGDGTVLEIEVTTNRPDCLSLLGLAREVSVLTGSKINWPKVSKNAPSGGKKPKIEVSDKKGCPLYTARLIENVSVKPAPIKIQKFLDLIGTRAINSVVDATNFVLFETGQPLHAFDADKIKGGVIIVRRARKDEKFLGIDGVEYTLNDKTLIIADTERPIAIAGVIGGKLTEVTLETKNILLESAYFDPALVRQASRFYKISTESSYRFERGVDPENVRFASKRAADLIGECAGGVETASHFVESKKLIQKKKIILRLSQIEALLGIKVSSARVLSILNSLGFSAKVIAGGKLAVSTSSARRDCLEEVDLIEEVLRIEGFDKIEASIPVTRHSMSTFSNDRTSQTLELKKFISSLGFNEIISYSLLSEKAMKDSNLSFEGALPHKITNALSAELEYFRPSLLPGMLQATLFNINRKASSLKLFEVGNRCLSGKEETAVSLCLYGNFEENWRRKTPGSFFDVKGALERIFHYLKIEGYSWKENGACPKHAASSSIYLGNKKVGTLGILSSQVQRNWDIPHEIIYAEIILDDLLELAMARRSMRVKPVPKFPVVRRDIAFVIDQKFPVQVLQETILKAGLPSIQAVELFDEYIGKNIAEGKRSLAFSLSYQKETGTFTDEEINVLQAKVGEVLKKEYAVEFR